jgi:hypothetical protein
VNASTRLGSSGVTQRSTMGEVMLVFHPAAWVRGHTGPRAGSSGGLLRRLVVLAFALIQLVLVARILLDLGVIPADWGVSGRVVVWSDAFAAPVAGITDGLFGTTWGAGSGYGAALGDGLNPVMLAALAGWTVVEGLVMRVVGRLATV